MHSIIWWEGYDAFYNEIYPKNPYMELADIKGFEQDAKDWDDGWQAAYYKFYGSEDDRSWDSD